MRHKVFGKKLSRKKDVRKSLFRNLMRSLIIHEQITTTIAKAKAIRKELDKLILRARSASLNDIRYLKSILDEKALVDKLIKEIAPRHNQFNSGFFIIEKLSGYRSDAAQLVRIRWKVQKKEDIKKAKERDDKKKDMKGKKESIETQLKKQKSSRD